MGRITISLSDSLSAELAEAAREQGRREAELASEAIEAFLIARRATLPIPPFARRIGPLALPDRTIEDDTSGT